jgi:hypothetical protein
MKKLYFLTLLFCSIAAFAQQQTVTSSINPPTFEETTSSQLPSMGVV